MASAFRVPHTLVLLFGMIVLAQGLTYVLPAGSYERVPVEEHHGREKVVPGSYHAVPDAHPLVWYAALTAIPKGLGKAQDIIFFIFLIGGALGVFRATGAADAGIGFLITKLGARPAWLIGGAMAAFAFGSATIGMAEEYVPFIPILIALCLGLGFDRVTAVGVVCVGYGVGYGAAAINPFTVAIAQEIAGLPPASGLGFRVGLLIVMFVVGFLHVWSYARKVKADPGASVIAGVEYDGIPAPASHPKLTRRHTAVLVAFTLALVVLVAGVKEYGWYLVEMGAYFVAVGVLLGLLGRLDMDKIAKTFCVGAAELTTTALLVGFARAIQVVLDEGQVVDTVIHAVAQPLQTLPPMLSAVGMLVVQSLTNFFVPSGSGQAFVTMPIMAPLADLVGVSRQVAVLAYQLGDGLTNILVPTNAVLIGILTMSGVPYDRWLRFLMPLMLKLWLVAALALVLGVWAGY